MTKAQANNPPNLKSFLRGKWRIGLLLFVMKSRIVLKLSFFVDVDYVTPLCSQLTYEGLLDETFGIKCGKNNSKPKPRTARLSFKLLKNLVYIKKDKQSFAVSHTGRCIWNVQILEL